MTSVRSARPASPWRPVTIADAFKRAGRAVLWLLVVMLLARGLAGVLGRQDRVARVPVVRPAAPSWPDDEARAFAVDFARVYLTFSPKDRDAQLRALAAFAVPELASSMAPEVGTRTRGQRVIAATVAGAQRLDERHSVITVAVTLPAGIRYLVVPVARDAQGGLAVDDLPSFAAPPARATVPLSTLDPITGPEQGALAAVVSRFLRAYLAGDPGALDYLVPAGVRITALASGDYALVDADSLAAASPAAGRVRELLVGVRVRELASGAVLSQRYRLRLERRDRWYVADINGSREG